MLIRIMACKEREDNVNKMLSDLWAPAEVIRDEKHDANDTLCRMIDTNEPLIAMEDDIILCNGFLDKVLAEIEKRPDEFIMFYSFWTVEKRHFEDSNYNWWFAITQAYYIPAWIGKDMAEFLRKDLFSNLKDEWRYDLWMYKFLVQKWIKMHLVKPSLCQHLWGTSLINNKTHIKHRSITYRK